ncbi:MAG: capsular biosynthesis protein [Methylotetracoccus sp.]
MKRRFLFLQGVISPFFPWLADQIAADGDEVLRINFCCGDKLFWGRRSAWDYRGAVAELPSYLAERFDAEGITDLVLFGDHRPIHRPAIELARSRGIRALVFEEGYVRPNWVTLDRGGVNAHSSLPRDPAWYLDVDRNLPRYRDGQPAPARLSSRAAYDIAYHLANAANPLFYSRYRTHRPFLAPVEYAGWIRRFSVLPLIEKKDAVLIREWIRRREPFFFLPLQLNSDVQITHHSPFRDMQHVVETVLNSFATHAETSARLLIKNHPLDIGHVPYRALIDTLSARLGIQDRVQFVETGHLPTLLEHARGVVTVNSTTGMSALLHRRPTIALGQAIYALPGLTYQGDLEGFWHYCEPPDTELFEAFRNTVIHTTQVNGSFYSRRGISLALTNVKHLMGERSPLEELLG